MKYFIDTEFIEDGVTIDLISIGIASEDGHLFYALNKECDYSRASDWVKQNVLVHVENSGKPRGNKVDIADDILRFVGENTNPQFWGDFAAYDWVALCQIFGTMMDLPKGWPMFCRDIQQAKYETDVRVFPEGLTHGLVPHMALDDAIECRRRYEYLLERGLRP